MSNDVNSWPLRDSLVGLELPQHIWRYAKVKPTYIKLQFFTSIETVNLILSCPMQVILLVDRRQRRMIQPRILLALSEAKPSSRITHHVILRITCINDQPSILLILLHWRYLWHLLLLYAPSVCILGILTSHGQPIIVYHITSHYIWFLILPHTRNLIGTRPGYF